MNVHKPVHLKKHRFSNWFFLPTGIPTNNWVFRSHLYHIWFQKGFQTYMLHWQAKPALSASLSILLMVTLLHFTSYEVFRCCDITQPEFPPYWQFFHCLTVFSTILEQFSIDYWYRDVADTSRDKRTMLNSNHGSQFTFNITWIG